jgi:hypothetical protein
VPSSKFLKAALALVVSLCAATTLVVSLLDQTLVNANSNLLQSASMTTSAVVAHDYLKVGIEVMQVYFML